MHVFRAAVWIPMLSSCCSPRPSREGDVHLAFSPNQCAPPAALRVLRGAVVCPRCVSRSPIRVRRGGIAYSSQTGRMCFYFAFSCSPRASRGRLRNLSVRLYNVPRPSKKFAPFFWREFPFSARVFFSRAIFLARTVVSHCGHNSPFFLVRPPVHTSRASRVVA